MSNPRNQERASFDISESEEAIGRVEAAMSALRTPHRIPIEGLICRLGRGAELVRHNRAMAWSNIYLQIIINFNGFPTEKQRHTTSESSAQLAAGWQQTAAAPAAGC